LFASWKLALHTVEMAPVDLDALVLSEAVVAEKFIVPSAGSPIEPLLQPIPLSDTLAVSHAEPSSIEDR
jgi:hypothetical protein